MQRLTILSCSQLCDLLLENASPTLATLPSDRLLSALRPIRYLDEIAALDNFKALTPFTLLHEVRAASHFIVRLSHAYRCILGPPSATLEP